MPKIVDKEKMRDAILDAALDVFADKGFHSTSVGDVAEAAHMAKGTIYIYFESKDTLTIAIVDRYFANISRQIMDQNSCETLDAFLLELSRTMDVSTEEASFYRVFFEIFGPSFGSDEFTGKVTKFFNKLGSYYAKRIAHLQTIGEIASHHDAASVGRVLASMLDGIVLHKGLFGISQKRHRRMINDAINVFSTGLQ